MVPILDLEIDHNELKTTMSLVAGLTIFGSYRKNLPWQERSTIDLTRGEVYKPRIMAGLVYGFGKVDLIPVHPISTNTIKNDI